MPFIHFSRLISPRTVLMSPRRQQVAPPVCGHTIFWSEAGDLLLSRAGAARWAKARLRRAHDFQIRHRMVGTPTDAFAAAGLPPYEDWILAARLSHSQLRAIG